MRLCVCMCCVVYTHTARVVSRADHPVVFRRNLPASADTPSLSFSFVETRVSRKIQRVLDSLPLFPPGLLIPSFVEGPLRSARLVIARYLSNRVPTGKVNLFRNEVRINSRETPFASHR